MPLKQIEPLGALADARESSVIAATTCIQIEGPLDGSDQGQVGLISGRSYPIALAKLIGDIATGQVKDEVEDTRDPAAVELGRKGVFVKLHIEDHHSL